MKKYQTYLSKTFCITLLSCLVSMPTAALTLEQYGLTVTSSGLVDQHSGLRWLSADQTLGTPSAVAGLLDQGWRIATEADLYFLLTREAQISTFSYFGDIPLHYEEFEILMDILDIIPNVEFMNSWMCRNYGDVNAHCNNVFDPNFEQPVIFAEDLGSATHIQFYTYISEAYLYGTFKSQCLDCVGTTMLVRSVPLPAGIWGFLAAILLLRPKPTIVPR